MGKVTEDVVATRTAGEAGWHVSRYNLSALVPGTKMVAMANLYAGTCADYTPIEMYLLSVLEELDENHPIIERFARRGIICRFDERAALESMGRASCAMPHAVSLTICPTMGCNFDCPYCFENHGKGRMSTEVQDDVIALARRMLDASNAKNLGVSWFGGEPLLAPDIIDALSTRLIALAEERGVDYHASIVTNGYLLTPDVVRILERGKVERAQVTIDGLGAAHDTTRHLVGGGPTFERIVSNLRDQKLPFRVNIRHNVHEDNRNEIDALDAFVRSLAEESGNDILYYPALVSDSAAANERGRQVGVICDSEAEDISVRHEAERFSKGRGHYCGAHNIWSIGIDDKGNLQKCWEAIDKTAISFGTAHEWDPSDPLGTASNPDNLLRFLNTANPVPDEECRECVWLPMCAGGCPYRRLYGKRACLPFKDDPDSYVLALHDRIGHNKDERDSTDSGERG